MNQIFTLEMVGFHHFNWLFRLPDYIQYFRLPLFIAPAPFAAFDRWAQAPPTKRPPSPIRCKQETQEEFRGKKKHEKHETPHSFFGCFFGKSIAHQIDKVEFIEGVRGISGICMFLSFSWGLVHVFKQERLEPWGFEGDLSWNSCWLLAVWSVVMIM